MRSLHVTALALALALSAPAALAQYYAPGDPTTDHRWAPDNSGFGLGTVGLPSPVMGTAGGSTGGSGTTSRTPPPPAEQKGYWVGALDCVNMPVCGAASAGRGWGFATWRQTWTCVGGTTCGAYPAGFAPDNSTCQTSYGNKGLVTAGICYIGNQPAG